jgi:hypothetical protein
MFTDQEMGEVDDLRTFAISLGPHEGKSLLVLCPGDHLVDAHPLAGERPSVRGEAPGQTTASPILEFPITADFPTTYPDTDARISER